jgi:hypothetical protein
MTGRIEKLIEQCTVQEFSDCTGGFETFDKQKFAQLIVQECIWAFGETRTEPSLEKYILDRLGINHE